MCHAIGKSVSARGVRLHVDRKAIMRQVREVIDQGGIDPACPGFDDVPGLQTREAMTASLQVPPAHGVGASSRNRPFALRSAQNSAGIG